MDKTQTRRVTLQALAAFRRHVLTMGKNEFSEWFHPELEGLTFHDTVALLDAEIQQCRSELGVRPRWVTPEEASRRNGTSRAPNLA